MNHNAGKQPVGRAICVLLILCFVSTKVSAVIDDGLEELQIFVEPSSDRALESKVIDKVDEPTQIDEKASRKSFIKSSEEPLGMDSLTLIWYLTTFTALLGFFVVMACTEKSCARGRDAKPPEARTCPPTPCPSYKNFAPPSYDTVMKKYKNQRVFIVPVHDNSIFSPNASGESIQHQVITTTTVDIEKGADVSAAISR